MSFQTYDSHVTQNERFQEMLRTFFCGNQDTFSNFSELIYE